ncbi:hypothetical protein LXM94_09070 [Rhizobium sp. TRM95111]|uniref:hypothetical protein n=1 Tax=Rhizobium alarense TaxID=2846851 RepID=UPI001F3C749D|nr:hypothetical protein [Rhizobium alarense]MCF3640118.1 hypothetical protein [Rhizobium alarense]
MTRLFSRLAPLAFLALALASCQTMTPEERRAADEAKCASYGFRRGSEAFAGCLQRIELDRRADARALRYSNTYPGWGWGGPVYVERRAYVRRR